MEGNTIKLHDLLPIVKEVLASGNEFRIHPEGVRMLPYLKEGRDAVMLHPFDGRPRRGDLLLYERTCGTLVLHRVVKVEKNGTISFRGDNQYFIERGIRPEQVIATVKRFYRNGKEIYTDALASRLYCARRTLFYPWRRISRALWRRAKRLFGKGTV